VEPGNTHVVGALHGAAHELRCHGRFLGDGHVGCARATNGDARLLRDGRAFQRDRARVGVVTGAGEPPLHGPVRLDTGPGHEERIAAGGEARGDLCDLPRRLAIAQNDFREARPQLAVVVEGSEAQVFVRKIAQALQNLVPGELALLQRPQYLVQPFLVDGVSSPLPPAARAILHRCRRP
jgi:hypothetical protein